MIIYSFILQFHFKKDVFIWSLFMKKNFILEAVIPVSRVSRELDVTLQTIDTVLNSLEDYAEHVAL